MNVVRAGSQFAMVTLRRSSPHAPVEQILAIEPLLDAPSQVGHEGRVDSPAHGWEFDHAGSALLKAWGASRVRSSRKPICRWWVRVPRILMPADFRSLTSVRQLANVTFAAEEVIEDFLSNPAKHLTRVVIPRHGSSRAPREAWKVATPDVKTFLGMLRLEFDNFLRCWFTEKYPQPCVQGYISGRSALTNARLHAGRRALVKVDVKDFFPSIRTSLIEQALLRLGLSTKGVELVARVVTHEGSLPLGYPASPLFSNVVLIDADRQLGDLATAYNATYSRYADDLTFSGDGNLPMLAEVADILRSVDLAVHPTKSKEVKRGQALYVTGYSHRLVSTRSASAEAAAAPGTLLHAQIWVLGPPGKVGANEASRPSSTASSARLSTCDTSTRRLETTYLRGG